MQPISPSRPIAALALACALAPVSASTAQASGTDLSGFTDPGEIDRVVAEFTGARIGETGGARQPADPRLRLARCEQALLADWHGTAQTTVSVACPDPGGWRIFIATRAPASVTAQTERVVKRGDPITVLVRGRGFSVQQPGEAMEAGGVGDWIAVRTTRRGEPVRARIERPGLAVIPAN